MKLQSNPALIEIRDSLLETYAINDAMNQHILSLLDPRAWRSKPPGEKSGGRTLFLLGAATGAAAVLHFKEVRILGAALILAAIIVRNLLASRTKSWQAAAP